MTSKKIKFPLNKKLSEKLSKDGSWTRGYMFDTPQPTVNGSFLCWTSCSSKKWDGPNVDA